MHFRRRFYQLNTLEGLGEVKFLMRCLLLLLDLEPQTQPVCESMQKLLSSSWS